MNTTSTGRDKIVMIDLDIWQKNPIFGVGPGVAMFHRQRVYKWIAAHTEFSRLLAEHGAFGALAILLLIAMAVHAVTKAKTALNRALAAAMLGWSLLFLVVDGMRLAAPSFAFGFSFVTLVSDSSPSLRAAVARRLIQVKNYRARIANPRPSLT
jgi:O-antigen ligase